MGRLLAIDYGTKRTGIAATDPLQIIANAVDTIETPKLFDFLTEYFEKESVDLVIVGEPFRADGSPAQSTPEIEKFIAKFKKKFPEMKVDREDESFSSKEAFETMIQSGISKKKRTKKDLVDRISATIILKNYMENKGL